MTEQVAVRTEENAGLLSKVLIGGDLSKLSEVERLDYYRRVCDSVGINPLTQPFAYIRLNGRLVLYALKGATDQLAERRGLTVKIGNVDTVNDCIMVKVTVSGFAEGWGSRTVEDIGMVSVRGLSGEAYSNAVLKCVTKARRRAILSYSGLGLDETEAETISHVNHLPSAGKGLPEVHAAPLPAEKGEPAMEKSAADQEAQELRVELLSIAIRQGISPETLDQGLMRGYGVPLSELNGASLVEALTKMQDEYGTGEKEGEQDVEET